MVLGAVSFPATKKLPGRDRAAAGSRVAQQSAVMRSQESGRGGPRQGLGWVGRGGRKVLRIWVSGQCGGREGWAWEGRRDHRVTGRAQGFGPWGRGYEHPDTPFDACQGAPRRLMLLEVRVRKLRLRQGSDLVRVCWQGPELGTHAGRPSPLCPSARLPPGRTPGSRRAIGQMGG